ncbi:MAG: hypothetical protein IIA09_12470 [Proteobacteria bacterium]|nr:hypothetical protein [Pseudomonadota bacterium]
MRYGHQFCLAIQFTDKQDAGGFAVIVKAVWHADRRVTGKAGCAGIRAAAMRSDVDVDIPQRLFHALHHQHT